MDRNHGEPSGNQFSPLLGESHSGRDRNNHMRQNFNLRLVTQKVRNTNKSLAVITTIRKTEFEYSPLLIFPKPYQQKLNPWKKLKKKMKSSQLTSRNKLFRDILFF